ncbi:MAG TPA: FAD-dependent oxidoreductase [Segetibacter sp.]
MKAVVIGGGIVGLSSAYYLQKSGWQVTVIDKTDMLDSCSYGNLGMIVPSHFVPLAAPGMISQGIRWMFNNKSPFYVKPSLNKDLISWGLKFMKSATLKHVDQAASYLLDINLFSKTLYEELSAVPGFDFAMEKKGILMYYKTQKVEEEEVHLGEKARQMGLDVEALSPKQVQVLEPHIDLDILGAVHYRSDAHLYPNHLIPQMVNHLKKAGVLFKTGSGVDRVVKEGNKIKKVVTSSGEYEADTVVMAAGSWLPELTKMAGVSISLMPGKGYSFTLKQPEKKLNVPAILCEARVAITPMNGLMRYGGTMEIGKVNDKVNMNRVEGIVEGVNKYFPNINLKMPEAKDIWYGFRPCTPDGLPYIGYSKKVPNLLIAGGHAMSGLSLGPATGKIVSELANGQKPSVKIDAFAIGRFN